MKRNKKNIIILLFTCVSFGMACTNSTGHTAVATTAPDLKEVKISLPQARGYDTYMANCRICHSEAYVQNQPNFTEEKWAAIVAKMKNTYGAPVSDTAAKSIIQYLTAIKGKAG